MLNRNIQSDNTLVIEMVRNDTDGMICFYGVNKCCIDGLECLNTWKRDLKDDNMPVDRQQISWNLEPAALDSMVFGAVRKVHTGLKLIHHLELDIFNECDRSLVSQLFRYGLAAGQTFSPSN